jgi:hypothetical protein
MRVFTHALYSLTQFQRLPTAATAVAYSRFKYGSINDAAIFGHALARQIIEHFPHWLEQSKETKLLLAASAYHYLPTAAVALTDYIGQLLDYYCYMRQLPPLLRVQLVRVEPFAGEYARLNYQQRQLVMKDNKIYVDKNIVANARLIVADDLKLTGLHEKLLLETLGDADITEILLLYIIQNNEQSADICTRIEETLNNYAIAVPSDLLPLIISNNFRVNARVAKFLLQQPVSTAMADFWQSSPLYFRQELLRMILAEGYAVMPAFAEGLKLLMQYTPLQDGTYLTSSTVISYA